MRPMISLRPLKDEAGAAIIRDDVEIAAIPPHLCIMWAMILLQASRCAELNLDTVKTNKEHAA